MRNRRGPGLTATATWTTTEVIPGARLVQQLQGFGYELTEAVTLEPHALGTRMSVADSLTPTSLAGRVTVSLSRGVMERDLQARFVRLKALLETRAAAEG